MFTLCTAHDGETPSNGRRVEDQFLGSNSTKSGVKCDLCGIDCYLDCALATENLHNLDDSALSALPMGDSAQQGVGRKTYLRNSSPVGML